MPRELFYVVEGGISRVIHHHANRYAIVTADRGDATSARNKQKRKHLKKMLKRMGYGYKRVLGRGQEHDPKTGTMKPNAGEHSFLVPGMRSKVAARIGRVYRQDAVVVGHRGRHRLLSLTGKGKNVRAKRDATWTKTHVRPAQYYTQVARGGWKSAKKHGHAYHHGD